jgi:hypothetical protein
VHIICRFSARVACRSLIVAAVLLAPAAARTQGTSPIPPSDLVYRDLDRLDQLGVLDSTITGQLPYSGRELARVVGLARRRLDTASPATRRAAEPALARLEARVAAVAGATSLVADEVELALNSTDALRRGLAGNLGAPTEATIDPLAVRRLGEPAVRGASASLELAQRAELGDWLGVNARERVELRSPSDPGISDSRAELLLGGVRARYRNVALMVGREQLAWALGEGQGLFLASDAPALDQISLSGDRPFRLPSFLRLLGPAQATLVLADLGASTVRSHSHLLAYKVSVRPTASLELGATFLNHFGGAGARQSSLGNHIIDFIPLIDVFRKHNYFDSTRTLDVESDKVLGLDGRLRLAALGGMLVDGEWLLDDFDATRLMSIFTTYGSQSLAVTFPTLGSPAFSLTLSAEHKGIMTGTHSVLRNGMTTRGRLFGDELGSDAKSFGAALHWTSSPTTQLGLEARGEAFGNAVYSGVYLDPARTVFTISKLSRTSDEQRELLIASYLYQRDARMAVVARAGAERIRNWNFEGGRRRDYVADLSLRVRP